jgi:hypothetical protein
MSPRETYIGLAVPSGLVMGTLVKPETVTPSLRRAYTSSMSFHARMHANPTPNKLDRPINRWQVQGQKISPNSLPAKDTSRLLV